MTCHQHPIHFQQPVMARVLSFSLLASIALLPIPLNRPCVKYEYVIPYNTLNYIQFYVISSVQMSYTIYVFFSCHREDPSRVDIHGKDNRVKKNTIYFH